MHTLSLIAALTVINMGTLGRKTLNASNVTRLAIDDDTSVSLSVNQGPVTDGKVEIISGFNYDENTFFVQVQNKPGHTYGEIYDDEQKKMVIDPRTSAVIQIADAFLSRKGDDGNVKLEADRFETIATFDRGRGIQDWSMLMVKRLGNGKYEVKNLGKLDIQKLVDGKYAVAFNGFANLIDAPDFLDVIADVHTLADFLQRGTEIPDGWFLARAPKGAGLHTTNGFDTKLYDQKLKIIDADLENKSDDYVGAPIMLIPAIDTKGKLLEDKYTVVEGNDNDWTTVTGDTDFLQSRGYGRAVERMQRFAA